MPWLLLSTTTSPEYSGPSATVMNLRFQAIELRSGFYVAALLQYTVAGNLSLIINSKIITMKTLSIFAFSFIQYFVLNAHAQKATSVTKETN